LKDSYGYITDLQQQQQHMKHSFQHLGLEFTKVFLNQITDLTLVHHQQGHTGVLHQQGSGADSRETTKRQK
jgi:hypothetical protein